MPTIEFKVSERMQRHLGAIRLMSYMVFPESPELRAASEATFGTILADWYSRMFADLTKEAQTAIFQNAGENLGAERSSALANPSEWMRNKLQGDLLKPFGGAVALTGSPSSDQLEREWTRRWWSIVYTGKLIALIGSMHQHHPEVEASVNKAIHILCKTDGSDKERMSNFRQCGFPQVYESSLKKAWAQFRPVAHLCGAYVTTETHFYEDELSRDFWEYWQYPPAFYDDEMFSIFCRLAKTVEKFAISFFPRGQRQPLITRDELFCLPDEVFESGTPLPTFRTLTEEEIAALESYRAPKHIV